MKALYESVSQKIGPILNRIEFLPALLARITVGWIFLESGWGKFSNLERIVGYFDSLGIPMASIQAPFIAGVEFFGGTLLLIGLLTRAASVPLIGVMAVALLTAHLEEITSFSSLFGLSPFLYILLLVWLIFKGPGKISIDYKLFGEK